MNKKLPTDDHLAGLRKKIGEIQDDLKPIKAHFTKPRLLARVWEERNWSIPAILAALGVIGTASWFVGGLILDKHIQSAVTTANAPLQSDIHRVDGDVQQVRAVVNVLQVQIAAQKYSAVPAKDLKSHRDELNGIKDKLAAVPNDTPGYWPVSFQIISLASKAASELENVANQPGESVFSDVQNAPLGGGFGPVENRRVVLKNLVKGMVFRNSVVRFDPSVRLVNDVFINCVFILPTEENPPKALQEIGKTLLASDLSNVILNAS